MNIQAPIKHTAAEEALFQSFETAREALGGNEDTIKARETALAQLRDNGLPTRRIEAWHYTDLRAALNHVADPSRLVFGKPLLTDAVSLVSGLNLSGVMIPEWNADAAELTAVERDDTIGQINTALASNGVIAHIADGVEVTQPLAIEKRAFHSRNVIKVGAGSQATFTQTIAGEDGFATDVTTISVGESGKATIAIVCEKGAEASDLSQLRVALDRDAELNIVIMNMGGKVVRREIVVMVEGEGSNLDIKGVNLIGGKCHIDVTTVLSHLVPNTNSTQLFRNIVTDGGKGVFQGQIRVHQIAQKTDAQMACNTLLLSDDGSFSAKPELEIFADDVICAHGATVAELDQDHMFYLMARGISERSAKALLVEAFVDEVVEELDDEALIEALEGRIRDWLDING